MWRGGDREQRAEAVERDRQQLATDLAVKYALRDAEIAGQIRDHGKHLDAINGSQAEMAATLKEVKQAQDKQLILAQRGVTTRALVFTVLGLLAAFAGSTAAIVVALGR